LAGWAVVGLGAALSLAACTASTQETPAVATGPSASTPARTAAPASIQTPQPTEPFAITEGQLPPGRYLQKGFPPGVSFVLGSGWQGYFDDADGAYLGGPQGIELGINKPPQVVDPKTSQPVESPADLAAWLAASPAFDSAKSKAVTVAGKPATLVDATSNAEKGLFAYTSGNFHTVAGARYWFYVFPMDGPDLVVMLLGPGTAFEASLPMIQGIVDSVKVGGT
jgi:hypothetical protein